MSTIPEISNKIPKTSHKALFRVIGQVSIEIPKILNSIVVTFGISPHPPWGKVSCHC